MNTGLFQTWKQAKILKDELIIGHMNLIAEQYGYIIQEGFGLHIQPRQKAYREERYAEVSYNGFSNFAIRTVSSSWTVSEATIMMKQLKEATECAAELNTFLESLDRPLKKEFDKEMAERIAASQS